MHETGAVQDFDLKKKITMTNQLQYSTFQREQSLKPFLIRRIVSSWAKREASGLLFWTAERPKPRFIQIIKKKKKV